VIGRFVREAARPFYGEGVGRRSIDPTVLVRLMLAGALEGIGSMRELLRVADLRLDLRLFLGGGFGERLPAHQAVSEGQRRRFAEGEVFERLFLRTVAFCKRHGLIEGSDLSPRSGPTPKRAATNATAVSFTDPEARVKGKPGQRPRLVCRGHVGVDPTKRCVVGCLGERAEGHEGDALAPLLDRVRIVLP
jgi:Transposase domain (DUF772)